MSSSNSSSRNSENLDANQDFISTMPTIVTDKILKRLPLQMATKMSVLSKTWRQNWLSQRHIVFDQPFWKVIFDKNGTHDSRMALSIINDVLIHHVGPIREFHAFIPGPPQNQPPEETLRTFSQWLSLLSKSEVNKMTLINMCGPITMPSELFKCKELRKLGLYCCSLDHPPCDFEGFSFLSCLELVYVPQLKEDVFESLIAYSPRLFTLKLDHWTGMKQIVINSPKLEILNIRGVFESLIFKSVISLRSASLCLYGMNNIFSIIEANNAIKTLASSSKLHDLRLGGKMCKFFGAGTVLRSGNLAFENMHVLHLYDIDLSDSQEFRFIVSMLQSCPFVQKFVLWIGPYESTEVPHNIEIDENIKLENLVNVEITGIRGSKAELDLIKYVLSSAIMLEKLAFRCHCLIDAKLEKKAIEKLMKFPRASQKAKVYALERLNN